MALKSNQIKQGQEQLLRINSGQNTITIDHIFQELNEQVDLAFSQERRGDEALKLA